MSVNDEGPRIAIENFLTEGDVLGGDHGQGGEGILDSSPPPNTRARLPRTKDPGLYSKDFKMMNDPSGFSHVDSQTGRQTDHFLRFQPARLQGCKAVI